MAYLLDPAEGRYLLDDLASRFLSLEVTSPDVREAAWAEHSAMSAARLRRIHEET